MTDYLSLWQQWLAFSVLPEEDGKTLLENIHEEVRAGTVKLGVVWMEGYNKDQHAAIIQSIDPILSLILGAVADGRVNQLLAMDPRVVDLPYKITERLRLGKN